MNLEEQVKQHKELSKLIDELEEKKKVLGMAIMNQMTEKVLHFPGYIVRRCSRLSVNVPIEEAKAHDAVKLEEVADKVKLKELYQQGKEIKGISEVNYIQVSEKPESC